MVERKNKPRNESLSSNQATIHSQANEDISGLATSTVNLAVKSTTKKRKFCETNIVSTAAKADIKRFRGNSDQIQRRIISLKSLETLD